MTVRARHRLLSALLLAACGGDAPLPTTPPPDPTVSKGLKIFVTSRTHIADFAEDPLLHGANAIEKADDFCMTDPARPDGSVYKALLVDGVHRDAVAPIGWVLQPATTYYRPLNDVAIATTTSSAIFAAAFSPLTHAIDGSGVLKQVWTGIGKATTFATGNTCAGWLDSTNANDASRGVSTGVDGDAFAAIGDMGCAFFQNNLYCVQQP